jgi:hypothetical protein
MIHIREATSAAYPALQYPNMDVHLVEAFFPPGCDSSVLSVGDILATHSSTTVLSVSAGSVSSVADSSTGIHMDCSLDNASRWCGPLMELERCLVRWALVQRPLCAAPFSVIRVIVSLMRRSIRMRAT